MQPYFLPYIGYFQLIDVADLFICYDNIKYTKKGWINRNRMLRDGKDVMFSVPLKAGSDHLDVRERELAADFDRDNLLNRIKEAYRRAPAFAEAFPLVETVVHYPDRNLFGFVHHAIVRICEHLGISTPIAVSSRISIDHELRGQDKVIALCRAVGATEYVNPIGGIELYRSDVFEANGLALTFLRPAPFIYAQFGEDFVPWLSIIDVMMFNVAEAVREHIETGFELVPGAAHAI